jgi:hypothetical protein
MTIKTLTTTLLLATSFLLFTACDSKVESNTIYEQNPIVEINITMPIDANNTIETNATSDDTTVGGNDDNTTTTPTVTLASLKLTIDKTSLNKDENTTVKVVATYSDNISKDVTEEVEWISSKIDAVKVTKQTLTALQDMQTTLQAKLGSTTSEKIVLDIYWEVNGYRLPSEPDSQVNNSTLLGIDSNDNGVRDDVERKIYLTFNKEIKRQYFMQEARLLQAMLADPDLIQNAHAWQKKNNYDIACGSYLSRVHNVIRKFENIQFVEEATLTTKNRLRKYLKYDRELSGGVYSVPNELRVESSCDFNVTKALETDK